jgi:chromosome segregation ATPase
MASPIPQSRDTPPYGSPLYSNISEYSETIETAKRAAHEFKLAAAKAEQRAKEAEELQKRLEEKEKLLASETVAERAKRMQQMDEMRRMAERAQAEAVAMRQREEQAREEEELQERQRNTTVHRLSSSLMAAGNEAEQLRVQVSNERMKVHVLESQIASLKAETESVRRKSKCFYMIMLLVIFV